MKLKNKSFNDAEVTQVTQDSYEFDFNIISYATRKTVKTITVEGKGNTESAALQNAADEAHKQVIEGETYLSYTQKFIKHIKQ